MKRTVELNLNLQQIAAFDMIGEIVATLCDYFPYAQAFVNADSGEVISKDMLEQTALVLGNLAGASAFNCIENED